LKPRRKFKNSCAHPIHGLLDVLAWQFGLRHAEESSLTSKILSPYQPQIWPERKLRAVSSNGVQITWIGHSTFLIQFGDRSILTDPIFGNCQPLPLSRLRRVVPPGLKYAELPRIHDVLISHCHYDHLDSPTIKRLGNSPRYWLPAGLKPWFHRRGIENCVELEWGQSAQVAGDLQIYCVPAQHFAARGPFDRDRTHWCGWVLRSSRRTVYFAGDTGYCPIFREIGERFGGFDLAMIPIGAYRPRWLMRPIHVDPFEAVQIHLDIRSRQSIACHWGTFRLTDEPLNEPPALLRQALSERRLPPDQFRSLQFGEPITV
jgi:N-acyl-phosphatidylethanolamine-hydrolysing phospholipase D